MSAEDDTLLALAIAVADGQPVNWKAAAKAEAKGDQRELIAALRALDEIGRIHRREPTGDPKGTRDGSDSGHDLPREPGQRRWGQFELRERLGAGAWGEVYRAWDDQLQRDVALKLLRPDVSGAAAVREGRLLARVRHPNVVTVHGAGEADGRVGIWMDLIEGRDLGRLVQEQGPLGPREAALIGMELCRALAAVHAAGLVHRDVKARNVLRERGGRIVLMDFGAGTDQPVTEPTLSGTPLYIAPEVLAGRPCTGGSDLYSLGVLLYHLVTRGYPIEAPTLAELKEAHARGKLRPLRDRRPDLPEPFVTAVNKALARDPEDRFSTAGQMEQALALAAGVEAPGVEAASVGQPRAAVSKRRGWIVGLGALLVAFTVVALVLSRRPPVALDFNAALYRAEAAGPKSLVSGSRIAPGDRLYLEVSPGESLHLYVLDEDERGAAFLLFPLPGFEPHNPLPGGKTHRLPGAREGLPLNWAVTSSGGREHLLLIASRRPLTELEEAVRSFPVPEESEAAVAVPLPADVVERLRGIGGLAGTSPWQDVRPPPRLAEVLDRLGHDAATRAGLAVRHIVLGNPAPADR